MSSSVAAEPQGSQRTDVRTVEDERGKVVLRIQAALSLLRRAVSDAGWTLDALALDTGYSRSYIHAVLSGEKRCALEFLAMLPRDVRARHACLVAEQYRFVVVKPSSPERAAADCFAGLLGLLRPRMAKSDLAADERREIA